jgi:colanic acid/amylovoran biosynthesis glycosyltransferase
MEVLTIYTNSFPYGTEETFLESEIKYLSQYFTRVYVIPFKIADVVRTLPDNVLLLSPVQKKRWSGFRVYGAGLLNCYRLFIIPELRKEMANISVLKSVKYLGYSILTKENISGILPGYTGIHYSYWLGFSTFALTLLKLEGKKITLVSRAHGYDLYEERGEKSLSFIRAATIKNLDRLFLISEHGRKYLLKKLPEFSEKYEVARLGTPDPEFTNPESETDSLTIVSCSAINPNKRINLILESLILFKDKYPLVHVYWHHLGTGHLMNEYIEKKNKYLNKSSVTCHFHGQLSNSDIFEFYKMNGVDLLVNVSENEGVPVSVMEAQSCSIPVAATSVGGLVEIVNNENGLLIPRDIEPKALAGILYDIYKDKERWAIKRKISREFWENNFNAETNYSAFANSLLNSIS